MPFNVDLAWLNGISGLFAFLSTLVFTPLVMRLAHRMDWLAHPKADRWHARPTALMGGIAIYAAALLAAMVFARGTVPWPIWAGATVMFVTGLLDDLKNIRPAAKIVAQVIATGLLLYAGYSFGHGWPLWVSFPLTFFWIIGITNAINLLDNMDGLATGIAAITAAVLAAFAAFMGEGATVGVAITVAGAAAGFLVFNFNPARIFMGDSGSLFLGYMLAALAVVIQAETASSSFSVYFVSAAVLAVPIFDTTLVTVMRTLSGRSVSQGGRDHSSHRLVFLGLSERQAVLTLYGISLGFGVLGLVFLVAEVKLFYALLILMGVALAVFGIHLSGADVYAESHDSDAEADVPKLFALLHAFFGGRSWKSIAAVFADLLLIVAAFILAHYLRYEQGIPPRAETFLTMALPIVVAVKILVFYGIGLYRSIWRHAGTPELVRIAMATTVAALLSFAVLSVLHGYSNMPRAIFFIDWMITTLAVTGVRFGFRGLRQYIASKRKRGRRVLLYGAGDAGLLSLRELRQNPELDLTPVGFIDDDVLKRGLSAQGLTVLGSFKDLQRVCEEHHIEEVLITASRMTDARKTAICAECGRLGVRCRLFHVAFHAPPRFITPTDITAQKPAFAN